MTVATNVEAACVCTKAELHEDMVTALTRVMARGLPPMLGGQTARRLLADRVLMTSINKAVVETVAELDLPDDRGVSSVLELAIDTALMTMASAIIDRREHWRQQRQQRQQTGPSIAALVATPARSLPPDAPPRSRATRLPAAVRAAPRRCCAATRRAC